MTDEPLTAQRVALLIQRDRRVCFADGGICWTAGHPRLSPVKESPGANTNPAKSFCKKRLTTCLRPCIISLKGKLLHYQGDELGLTQADIPHEKMQDPFGIQGLSPGAGSRWLSYPHALAKGSALVPASTEAPEPWLPHSCRHSGTGCRCARCRPRLVCSTNIDD